MKRDNKQNTRTQSVGEDSNGNKKWGRRINNSTGCWSIFRLVWTPGNTNISPPESELVRWTQWGLTLTLQIVHVEKPLQKGTQWRKQQQLQEHKVFYICLYQICTGLKEGGPEWFWSVSQNLKHATNQTSASSISLFCRSLKLGFLISHLFREEQCLVEPSEEQTCLVPPPRSSVSSKAKILLKHWHWRRTEWKQRSQNTSGAGHWIRLSSWYWVS